MFDNLTDLFVAHAAQYRWPWTPHEDNVKDTLREVRSGAAGGDVALPVVREFINRVKEKAVGHEGQEPGRGAGVRQNSPQRTGCGDGRSRTRP